MPPVEVPEAIPIDEPEPPNQLPSFKRMMHEATSGTPKDYWEATKDLYRSRCFQFAAMWGLGLGALFALHRLKESSELIRHRVLLCSYSMLTLPHRSRRLLESISSMVDLGVHYRRGAMVGASN